MRISYGPRIVFYTDWVLNPRVGAVYEKWNMQNWHANFNYYYYIVMGTYKDFSSTCDVLFKKKKILYDKKKKKTIVH